MTISDPDPVALNAAVDDVLAAEGLDTGQLLKVRAA